MKDDQDHFNVLEKLTLVKLLRDLSSKLGFSLGKLNYCLKNLKQHGLIRIEKIKKVK